ncbi:MAG: TetR/AcrR family transcriptional regulator [Myxococcales bacterium]
MPAKTASSETRRAASPRTRSRPRGRPPKSAAEHELVLRTLLDATRNVFARGGYRGLSVELVLAESGLSRPTFYKHFRSMDDAMETVFREVNQDLMRRLLRALQDTEGLPLAKVEASLVAWRDWGAELGLALRPLFAELHDAASPASRHRKQIMALLAGELERAAEQAGRPKPSRLVLDTVLQGVEFLGYHYHLETARDANAWKATRDAMLRLAFGLLATPQELTQALFHLESLDVDLNPESARADAPVRK